MIGDFFFHLITFAGVQPCALVSPCHRFCGYGIEWKGEKFENCLKNKHQFRGVLLG